VRVFTCLLLCSVSAMSQSGSTGALEGLVRDALGERVGGAIAVFAHHTTGQKYSVTADDSGAYRLSLLAPGTYEVSISHAGYRTARMSEIELSVSEAPLLEATLEPGDPSDVVICVCRISTSAPSTGTLVDAIDVVRLRGGCE
jgi:hypothetical protein